MKDGQSFLDFFIFYFLLSRKSCQTKKLFLHLFVMECIYIYFFKPLCFLDWGFLSLLVRALVSDGGGVGRFFFFLLSFFFVFNGGESDGI